MLADLLLPDAQGIEVYARLHQLVPRLPILILCGPENVATARLAMRLGAQDYLLRERLDDYELAKAIDGMMQRAAIAAELLATQDRARATLDSIGDAIISSDPHGRVTYLNEVAETMTGWTLADAAGQPVDRVLRLVDAATHTHLPSPMLAALQLNQTVGLTANCLMIGAEDKEVHIEDSAAPIRDRDSRVTGAVMVFHDVEKSREQSRRMSFLAQHDGLTDLPNRALLSDRLSQALGLAGRHPGKKLAVLFVDVDHFKQVNDTLGHAVGDELLQSVARRLLTCVRRSDTVSRHGGDEFVVLLPEINHLQDAATVAGKILAVLRAPHRIGDHLLRLTGSIGIALSPDAGSDGEHLLHCADLAMYRAKADGRDRLELYGDHLVESATGQRIPIGG